MFSREKHCGDAALVVVGEVDVSSEPAFRRELLKLVNSAHSVAWLDLAELRFVDGCVLSALLDAREIGRQSDVDLVLRTPSLPVRRLLAVMGWLVRSGSTRTENHRFDLSGRSRYGSDDTGQRDRGPRTFAGT